VLAHIGFPHGQILGRGGREGEREGGFRGIILGPFILSQSRTGPCSLTLAFHMVRF